MKELLSRAAFRAKLLDIRADPSLAVAVRMSAAKCYVYVLRSLADRTRFYAGTTKDWHGILDAHNSGKCSQSADGRPWAVDLLVPFDDEARAARFERYVKSAARGAARDRHG